MNDQFLNVLKSRFISNSDKHPKLKWDQVLEMLSKNKQLLQSLSWMEETEGEPDILNLESLGYCFIDCAKESPMGRRSLCYDKTALDSRKQNKPVGDVISLTHKHGVQLLTETQYRQLQQFHTCDTKTSSWVFTPEKIRKLGGALFCDSRYQEVFTYHNGAESYYASRGFRVLVKI